MKIPYSEFEMQIAMMKLNDKLAEFDKATLEQKKQEMQAFTDSLMPKKRAEQNKLTAEYHGISVKQLMASPVYGALCNEYKEDCIRQFVEMIKEKLETTDLEAWAAIYFTLLR